MKRIQDFILKPNALTNWGKSIVISLFVFPWPLIIGSALKLPPPAFAGRTPNEDLYCWEEGNDFFCETFGYLRTVCPKADPDSTAEPCSGVKGQLNFDKPDKGPQYSTEEKPDKPNNNVQYKKGNNSDPYLSPKKF